MDNIEKDPWANIGNLPPTAGESKNEEINPEDLERAAQWESALSDMPESINNPTFNTPDLSPREPLIEEPSIENSPLEESPDRDKNIANANLINKYSELNAAAREKGVETVIQAIKNFVPNGTEDPIKQLLFELGFDDKAEISDLNKESRAIKSEENNYLHENVNAPVTTNKSTSDALKAISEVKNLIAEVENSPDYSNLRAKALKNGKSIFEWAVIEYEVHDLTTLFDALSKQKGHLGANEETPTEETSPEENPDEEPSTEENSTKETETDEDLEREKFTNLLS